MIKKIQGGVTAAKGFQAAATEANIKYKGRTDLAMVYSTVPCRAAGTFTKNLVKAAPVKWDQAVVYDRGRAQAVVVNSGIAECSFPLTGSRPAYLRWPRCFRIRRRPVMRQRRRS